MNKIVYLFLLGLMLTTGCVLQDNTNIPKNSTPTTAQPMVINQTPVNTTNTTVVEPPKPVLVPVPDKFAVYVMDTETKGSYIITSGKSSILINAQGGFDGLRNLKTIKNLGIANLDKFILTNNEDNNIAGASQIILRAKPLELIHSGIPSTSTYYKQYDLLYPNSTIIPSDKFSTLGDMGINYIVPYDDGTQLTSDNSVVVKVGYGNTNVLFATDCAIDCESRIDDAKLDAQILVSNGGCNSLSLLFLQKVFPDVVIFSGKPCAETLERAKSLAIPVLVTSTDGDILITSDGLKYEYKSLKSR